MAAGATLVLDERFDPAAMLDLRGLNEKTAGAGGFVTIGGSLYLIGEAMELLHLSPGKTNSERGLNEWGGTSCAAQPTAIAHP